MWVYQKTDKGYEVGYFAPSGEGWLWYLDEIFGTVGSARRRVCYLNGGGSQ
jgi:hypothetical protein